MKSMYVYIATNHSKTLYIGVTNNLQRRMYEHKAKIHAGFTAQYNISKLVYFEECSSATDAIRREKQLKKWSRGKKIDLIESMNPSWSDYSQVL